MKLQNWNDAHVLTIMITMFLDAIYNKVAKITKINAISCIIFKLIKYNKPLTGWRWVFYLTLFTGCVHSRPVCVCVLGEFNNSTHNTECTCIQCILCTQI